MDFLWQFEGAVRTQGSDLGNFTNRKQFVNSVKNNPHQRKREANSGVPGGLIVNQAIS